LFYLARELKMTVEQLTANMGVREYRKWMVFLERKAAAERGEEIAMDKEGEDFGRAFGAV